MKAMASSWLYPPTGGGDRKQTLQTFLRLMKFGLFAQPDFPRPARQPSITLLKTRQTKQFDGGTNQDILSKFLPRHMRT